MQSCIRKGCSVLWTHDRWVCTAGLECLGLHAQHHPVTHAAHSQGKPEEQLRALRTLAGMAKRRASAVPVAAVQSGFRQLGAFRPLVQLMHNAMLNPQVCSSPTSYTGYLSVRANGGVRSRHLNMSAPTRCAYFRSLWSHPCHTHRHAGHSQRPLER